MVQPEEQPQPAQATAAAATGEGTNDTTTTASTTASTKSAAPPPPRPAPKNKGYAFLFKYVLVGDCGAGKTALLKRFAKDEFVDTHIYTIGVDFDVKTIDLPNGDEVKLQMWDTAGQERFRTITNSYYRGANGIVVVYDITDEESFNSVSRWVLEAQRFCNDDTMIVVVGTKKDQVTGVSSYGRDQVRQLLQDEGLMKSEKENSPSGFEAGVFEIYEASAKTGEGVEEAFRDMTDKLVAQRLNERNPLRARDRGKKGPSVGHETIRLGESRKKPISRCLLI